MRAKLTPTDHSVMESSMIRSAVFVLFMAFVVSVPARAQDAEQSQQNAPVAIAQDAQKQSGSPGEIKPAQTENPPGPESHGSRLHWQDIPRNVLHDEKAIFTSPFHINRDNAKWWILFGTATAALIATDQRVSNTLPQTTGFTGPSTWTSRIGADYTLYPAWSVFYFVGKIGDNPRARDTGRIGIEAMIDSEIAVNILKAVTQRPRPEIQGQSVGFFKGGDSFPSGHSIMSWSLARVVSREYADQKWVPILAYGLASTVSVSRWGGRRHNPSDVLVGSAMGFFIGDFVYNHHHAPSEKSNVARWVVDHVNFQFGFGGSPIQNNRLP
jgi:membrane-associated phospholipid phosphatase